MLISDEQHQANLKNAKNSTGPKTPEGKAAVSLNALTYGLRARTLILPTEDPEEYKQLYHSFEAELQPQGELERIQVQQMAIAQWFLARLAYGERIVYREKLQLVEQFALLRQMGAESSRHERSYYKALHELQNLQERRDVRDKAKEKAKAKEPAQPNQTKPTAKPSAQKPEPPPEYVMSPPAADPAIFCAPTPDTR